MGKMDTRKARKARELLLIRDGDKCWICGKAPKKLTIDHLLPQSLGGRNNLENLKLACRWCNIKRGNAIVD